MLWRTSAIVRARLVRIHQLFIFLLTFYLGALQCGLWCSLLSAWLVFSQFLSFFCFYFHSDIWTNIRQGINRNHSHYWNSTKFSMDRNLPCCFPSFFFSFFPIFILCIRRLFAYAKGNILRGMQRSHSDCSSYFMPVLYDSLVVGGYRRKLSISLKLTLRHLHHVCNCVELLDCVI